MFDVNELEKGMRMAKERETIRVIHEDGTEKEFTAGIWTFCGLDKETSAEFTVGKICLVGGDEIVADAIIHVAQLMCVAHNISNAIIQSVPWMTEKRFLKMLVSAAKDLKKKHEGLADA